MFEGFSQEALDFLNDIRFNNHQQFYEANRTRYEQYVKAPLRELSEELAPAVQLIDPRLDTQPGRTMSRIRRDTRYTKDKSPFRDHVWLGWRYPGEGRAEGFHMYWGFGADWLGWGCGSYYTDKPMMDALRLEIRRHPDEVRRAIMPLEARFTIYGENYKKIAVPADVPEDLKPLYVKKYVGFEHNGTQEEWTLLHTHAMADVITEDLSRMASIHRLMRRMRTQAEQAAQEAVREREEQARAAASQDTTVKPEKLTIRTAEEFEF